MKLVIAEDHPLMVEGLATLLSSNGYEFCVANTVESLFQILANNAVDLIIQDIRFGQVDARTVIPDIRKQFPFVKLIALTSLDDKASIQSVLALNISGYILKSESPVVILEAIKEIQNDKVYLSQEVQKILANNVNTTDLPVLSQREREVLTGILAENSTKEIADKLFVSEKTVEHYRANLFTKFEVKNVSGLVKKSILLGFYLE